MEENIRFSIVLYIRTAHSVFFRDCLDSIAESMYRNFELIIIDSSGSGTNGSVAEEFFPEAGRLKYFKVRPGRNRGYSLNYAVSHARGNFLLFMDCHSRMAQNALAEMAQAIIEKNAAFVYSDHDELIGNDRMNPAFKCAANTELIRHKNYIGEIFAISVEAADTIGAFRDALEPAVFYDFILRAFEAGIKMVHIPRLLFSLRKQESGKKSKEHPAKGPTKEQREHMTVVTAHLRRMGIDGDVKPLRHPDIWRIDYDGSGYKSAKKDFLLVREGGTRISFRESMYRMYGHLKQPDVGIVGGAFLKNFFTYDNCGYIFDTSGICYPACHGQSVFLDGYGYRCIIPQDVSAVDFGFCMIKKKLFKHLKGFDTSLTGRDMMLDFCLRTRKAGFRIVYEPAVRIMRRRGSHESSAASNEMLMEKMGDVIREGDPFYNRNLPMGLENYFLY